MGLPVWTPQPRKVCCEGVSYEDMVTEKLARRIEMPKVVTKILEIYSEQQIKALFKAIATDSRKVQQVRDRAILSILLDAGLRASELVGLTLDNCILSPHQTSYLRVYGKGRKWRQVPLGLSASIALRRYIERYRPNKGDAVFISQTGKPLTINGLNQLIQRLCDRANVTGIERYVHSFRHTMAVRYLQSGGDIYSLSIILGHTSVKITEGYLRAFKSKEVLKSSVSVLDTIK